MKLIKVLAISALITTYASTGLAAPARKLLPDAVVASLYKQHKKRSPFFQTLSRALLDQFFEKDLADLIWKDAVTSKREEGALYYPPSYNAPSSSLEVPSSIQIRSPRYFSKN